MTRFYLLLWVRWVVRVTLCSVGLALLFSLFVTFYLYLKQGVPTLDNEVWSALFQIFKFWFFILWNFTLLIALFRSLKYIFNQCNASYKLVLFTCQKQGSSIEVVGYGDLIKVWRKWLMLLIWLVGVAMILAVAIVTLFTATTTLFEWFNIYILYLFVLVAGYFSFILLTARCKLVKVKKC